MPKLNWEIILYNIAEAREQLEQIEELARGEKKPHEVKLQIMLEHAYHHLNFAWNIRHVSTKRYSKLSDDEFNEWSKFPKEIEVSKIEKKAKRGAKKRAPAKS
jgi:hypothetical protein